MPPECRHGTEREPYVVRFGQFQLHLKGCHEAFLVSHPLTWSCILQMVTRPSTLESAPATRNRTQLRRYGLLTSTTNAGLGRTQKAGLHGMETGHEDTTLTTLTFVQFAQLVCKQYRINSGEKKEFSQNLRSQSEWLTTFPTIF